MNLDARRRAEDQDLARRSQLLRTVIIGKVSDAAAHAGKALTDTLNATDEGRPTAARVRRSASYQAALARLDELHEIIVKAVEDFRAKTYVESHRFWWLYHEPAMRRSSDPTPATALIERCRTTLLHGYTVRKFTQGPIDRATAQLLPALTVAGNRVTSGSEATAMVTRWKDAAINAIAQNATTALVDSQTLADRRAGRDTIRRDLLHDDPQIND